MTTCASCQRSTEDDDIRPDPNGDPTCSDCLSLHAAVDDAAEWRAYAYR